MCDPGEKVSQTLKREFMEEALNSEEMTNDEKEHFVKVLGDFFNGGKEVKLLLRKLIIIFMI